MSDENSTILDAEVLPLKKSVDTDTTIQNIIQSVKGYNPGANTDMIEIAYKIAKNAHRNQFRKSGTPYIEHPVQIAYIASQFSLDATTIAAALLHDVVEDTPYTYDDIVALFGKSVADLVDG
ncbi:MAG: HD domain-containing protein, partial [Clostridia bacterium]|nr:HD domain-containing protein [Clostridia bacterium]